MALTVSTAPQYSGNLSVSTAPAGTLSMGTNTGMQGSTYNPQQTVNGAALQGGGGGGVMLGATTGNGAAVADPGAIAAAQAAAQARANAARQAGLAVDAATSGANQAVADNRLKYGNDSGDFATGIQTGQNTINTGRANNQLNLRRTMSGIAAGIRQGVRSGGVTLANMNALDSGAAEAMARAYAQNGNSQAADANNQAQLKENEFDTSQANLEAQRATGLSRLKAWRDNETNRVSQKLFNDLRAADATAADGGAGGVVDMGARDRIIAQAARELDQIDAITQGTLSSVHGYNPDEARAKAMEMDAAGAQSSPFTVEAGGMSVNSPSGPALGQFGIGPVYRNKDQQAGLV